MLNVAPPGSGTLDVVLSNLFMGYTVQGGVADLLAPRVGVGTQTGRYLIANTDDGLVNSGEASLRAPGASAAETNFSSPSFASYNLNSRAWKTPITDEDRAAYKIGDLEVNANTFNAQRIMTDREYRVATLAQNPNNYLAANTLALSGTTQFDNAASDPIVTLRLGIRQIARYADRKQLTAFMASDVFNALATNKNLRSTFTGVSQQIALTEEQLAITLGVKQVVVCEPVQAVAGLRQYLWSNTLLLAYVQSSDKGFSIIDPATGVSSLSPLDASFMKTFVWNGGDCPVPGGYGTFMWRDPDISRHTAWVSTETYMQEYITAQKSAYLFTNCLGTPSA